MTVREKFPDRDEEHITDYFHAELDSVLSQASSAGAVADSFMKDLRASFPTINESDLSKISNGLVATVDFHPRYIERRTGGDIGLVFIRPNASISRNWESELGLEYEYKRGLLVQAKIFRRNSRWASLSQEQKRILKDKLRYVALLLYRYVDQHGPRRELGAFHWQLTSDATIERICTWLRTDEFPALQNSNQVLGALSSDRIGTDDKEVIERVIAPPNLRPSLEIRVKWKDGTPPPPERVRLNMRNSSTNQPQQVRLRN
jgi:hypothetical protein